MVVSQITVSAGSPMRGLDELGEVAVAALDLPA
jgi:hypothetical protein